MRNTLGALARSTPFHYIRPPAHTSPRTAGPTASWTPVPEASCSRWFSCSHCQARPTSHTAFFSSAQVSSPRTSARHDPPAPPTYTSDQPVYTSRLPLPPPLPYSPQSVPFQRHMAVLQLSLSAHPDEAWMVYQALHPSLRIAVPNDTYAGLIHQQLRGKDKPAAWKRVRELLDFAEECGMKMGEFGIAIVERAFRLGLGRAMQQSRRERGSIDIEPLKRLWNVYLDLNRRHLLQIPPDTRRRWSLLLYRNAHKSGNYAPRRIATSNDMWEMMDLYIQCGDWRSLDMIAGPVLAVKPAKSQDTLDDRTERLRQLARLMSLGVSISPGHLSSVVGRAVHAMAQGEADGPSRIESILQDIFREEHGARRKEAESRLREEISSAGARHMSRLKVPIDQMAIEKGRRLLADPESTVPHMISHALLLANLVFVDEKSRKADRRPQVPRVTSLSIMNLLLALFDRIAYHALADPHVLVAVITRRLLDFLGSNQPEAPAMVVRFATALFASDMYLHMDDKLVHLIFDALVRSMDDSNNAYNLARRVYAHARSVKRPYTWSASTYSDLRWKRLFRTSLRGQTRHIHFASRLYADRLADGLTIPQQDMLRFIRAIGSGGGVSKYVLLERHLKDYLHFEYGSLDEFVTALVDGLVARRRGREAWLGFHLSVRIMGDRPLPAGVYLKVVDCLSQTRRGKDFRLSFAVMEYLDPGDPLRQQLYAVMFDNLVDKGMSEKRYRRPEEETAALAREIYAHMVERDVALTAQVVGNFVNILVKGGYVAQAMGIVRSLVQHADTGHSNIIAQTIAALEAAGYPREASELDKLSKENPSAEKGIPAATESADAHVSTSRRNRTGVELAKGQGRTGGEAEAGEV